MPMDRLHVSSVFSSIGGQHHSVKYVVYWMRVFKKIIKNQQCCVCASYRKYQNTYTGAYMQKGLQQSTVKLISVSDSMGLKMWSAQFSKYTEAWKTAYLNL